LKSDRVGIKLADGSLYPVLEESFAGRKRLVLTTVHDNQQTVQIDLYKGDGRRAEEATYIGSLMIENIGAAPQREPEIELVLAVDEQGNLEASATEPQSGERQSLSVNLRSVAEPSEEGVEVPEESSATEFELEEEAAPPTESAIGVKPEEPLLTGETYPIGAADRRKTHLRRERRHPLRVVGFVILGIVIAAIIAFVLFRILSGEPMPRLFRRAGQQQEQQLPEGQGASTAGSQTGAEAPGAAQATEGAASATAQGSAASGVAAAGGAGTTGPAAATAAEGGVWYTIRWGDTLWDLAASYYRNPWLYPRIATANRIPNPDLIIAGRELFIPEQ
jgi:hypothetical protein